ncbi:MAG: hypothetical protein LBT27_03440 [Prevotellaceae bacterium]|nr:hypothetical protein [Prevotellaceae bacterium]
MQTTGIKIERDDNGIARYARIDLRKYGKVLAPFFKKIGIDTELSPYNPEFVAKIKKAESQASKKIDLTKYGISI